MKGSYTEEITDSKIPFRDIVAEIVKVSEGDCFQVEQFCDSDINYQRKYQVFRIAVANQKFVLKKTDEAEVSVYEKLLKNRKLPAPEYYGCTEWNGTKWILIEFVPGSDLRNFTREMAAASADSIATVMNAYWQNTPADFETGKVDDRFEKYWKRINKRAECLDKEPELKAAYDKFLERQLHCPRTLSNGDFLQFNGLFHEGRVTLIDWGFAGIMPYSLDIARLIAHGTEDKRTFPFYMDDTLREIYIKEVYDKLHCKPQWEQYLLDIKLAVLNEYIEFAERELKDDSLERDEVFSYYYNQALTLAREIF